MQMAQTFNVGGINTTEICNLKCEMCLFHGTKFKDQQNNMRNRTLATEHVEKFLYELPQNGQTIFFCAFGEYFIDPNALSYLNLARKLGFTLAILTNGTLLNQETIDAVLEAGVRLVVLSVDACSDEQYTKIRKNTKSLDSILATASYLQKKKSQYPDLVIQTNNVLMGQHSIDEFSEFWSDKVDVINSNALMTDPYSYTNILGEMPTERCDCLLSEFLTPSGLLSPCCTINSVYANDDLKWLPHIKDHTPLEAFNKFVDMYYDHKSPLAKHCRLCSSWIRFHPDGNKFFQSTLTPLYLQHTKNMIDTGYNSSKTKNKNFQENHLSTFHVFLPEPTTVIPTISANNFSAKPVEMILKNISIKSLNHVKFTWNGKRKILIKKLLGISQKSAKVDAIEDGLLINSVEAMSYDYIWKGSKVSLPAGWVEIAINGFAFSGNAMFGLLDVNSNKWLMNSQDLWSIDK